MRRSSSSSQELLEQALIGKNHEIHHRFVTELAKLFGESNEAVDVSLVHLSILGRL